MIQHSFTPVYLLRKGNPAHLSRRFLTSFFRFDPGENVRLTVLLKGFVSGETPSELQNLSSAKTARLDIVRIDDNGMDLTAYRSLCLLRNEKHFLFFNSSSRIQSAMWYEAFSNALDETNEEGLIGASGSFEAHPEFGVPSINPHIRTNGFLVGREAYLAAATGPLLTKRDCHQLESGEHSLTRYYLDKGLPVLLVNVDKRTFPIEAWPSSCTFRLQDQEKLLFSDNRSEKYHSGFQARRKHHALASWGKFAQVDQVHIGKTIKRLLYDKLCANGHRITLLKILLERELSK